MKLEFVEYKSMLSNSKKTMYEKFTFINGYDYEDITFTHQRSNMFGDWTNLDWNVSYNPSNITNKELYDQMREEIRRLARKEGIQYFKRLRCDKNSKTYQKFIEIKENKEALRAESDRLSKMWSDAHDAFHDKVKASIAKFKNIMHDDFIKYYVWSDANDRLTFYIQSPSLSDELNIKVNNKTKEIKWLESSDVKDSKKKYLTIEEFEKWLSYNFPSHIDFYNINKVWDINKQGCYGLDIDNDYNGRDDRALRDIVATELVEKYGSEYTEDISFNIYYRIKNK
jgi:hypothetical protein